ncbi:MAG: hypothetical protein ABIT71_01615, partial [Vicinamibacteraceae bacterium]
MRLVRSGTLVLGGRLLQLATGAILALLLPRLMSAAEVGTFFLAQVAIAVGAVIAQWGLPFIVPGAVGEALARRDGAAAGAICRAALLLCALASLGVCASAALGAVLWPDRSGVALGFAPSTLAVILAIVPFAALGTVLGEMHRASRGIAIASLLPNAQGLAVAGLAIVATVLGRRPDAGALLLAGLAGVAMAFAVGLTVLQRRLDLSATSDEPRARIAGLSALAWPVLMTNVGAVGLALADTAIAGVVGGAVDAAHYGLGLRLSSLLALPLGVVNVTLTPRIVALWADGDRPGLQRVLTITATAASGTAVLGLLGLLGLRVVGLQAIWDASYAPALTIGVILGLGQVLQACGGSSGHLLMLLGHQKAFMRVSLTVGVIAVVLGSAAMTWWGITGLAAVMALATAGQTLACVLLARRRLGLQTWPRPGTGRGTAG